MRILGIDLGTSSIKAVELDSAFGRFEIREYHEQRIGPDSNAIQATQSLLKNLKKPPDRIAIALRTCQVTFRTLQLPTRDKKAIQASLGFELEDELPFPIEDAVYDYSILTQVGQTTHLHTAATLKKNLESSLQQWNPMGLDPELVTTEPWAYRALFNRILGPANPEAPLMLVNIGIERTVLYVHWRNQPVVVREITWGGRDLTSAICRKYGIRIEEAESAKLDHGFVIPFSQRDRATPDQIEFSETLLEPLQELLIQIRQTEFSCKSSIHEKVSTLYLSGGSALLPGLAPLIQEELHIPTKMLQALSAIASSGVTYSEQSDATFALAAGCALCLVGQERSVAINFRKGSFAKEVRSRELGLSAFKRPLIATAVILFSLFTSVFIQKNIYHKRIEAVDTDLERNVRSFFGQISKTAIRGYLTDPGRLRTSINKELNKQRELNRLVGINLKSPLNFLKTLSGSIPKDVVEDLIHFQEGASPTSSFTSSEEPTATLTFLVSNPQMAERLAAILNNKLSNFQRSQMEEVTSPDSTSKRWKITFSGKPTEDSYGK